MMAMKMVMLKRRRKRRRKQDEDCGQRLFSWPSRSSTRLPTHPVAHSRDRCHDHHHHQHHQHHQRHHHRSTELVAQYPSQRKHQVNPQLPEVLVDSSSRAQVPSARHFSDASASEAFRRRFCNAAVSCGRDGWPFSRFTCHSRSKAQSCPG